MKFTEKIYSWSVKTFSPIGKRQRFIISTMLLTILYAVSTLFSFEEIYIFVPLIVIAVYICTAFAILEGLTKQEWLMLFIHPIYFSVVWYLFYFFVPQRWLTRLPFLAIYIVFTYAILLSQNIFNVGVSKSLQLFRAAFSVNYLFLTIGAFLSTSLIISLRLNFLFNAILIFAAMYPLVLHMLWSVEPKEYISKQVLLYSCLISTIIAEAGLILSFVPINQSIYALVLTSLFYSLTGTFHVHLQGALFKERIREFIFVSIFALGILLLTIKW